MTEKVVIKTSQFSRELLEKMYNDIQVNKDKKSKPAKGA